MDKTIPQSELILNAAYRVIAEKGYADSSLRHIARDAGVTLSQLHYYYGSKQSLFEAVIERLTNRYMMVFKAYFEKESSKYRGLESMSDFVKDTLKDDRDLFKILFDLASLSLRNSSFKGRMTELFQEVTKMIESVLADSQLSHPTLEAIDKKVISSLLLSTMLGVAFRYSLTPDEDDELLPTMDVIGLLLA